MPSHVWGTGWVRCLRLNVLGICPNVGKVKTTGSIVTFLKKSEFFCQLSLEEVRKIARECKVVSYRKGEIVIRENEISDRFYMIQAGSVEILKNHGTDSATHLSQKTAGSGFGEIALIDDVARSATVITLEDSQFLCLSKGDFFTLCNSHPTIMFAVMKTLGGMIRASNESFVSNLSKQNAELQHTLEELKATQMELIRSERFSNLGKLSSMIIHDLRNPLSIIKGYGEMLQVLYNKPEQVREYSTKIVKETNRLNQFAQELLDYSRGEIRLSWVFSSLPMIFQKLDGYLQKNLQDHDITLTISCKDKEAFYVDESRIIRAILNVCDNARKAMANGGSLSISGKIETGNIEIVVTDNGHGMDKTVRAHIFDPFFSSSQQGGTGLGMLSVKSTVEAHKGSVSIESEPNTGTSVTICLPYNGVLPE